VTSLIMIFIKYVCRVPLRMTDEMCAIGDYAIHGEEPYTFEYYNRNYRRVAGGDEEVGKMGMVMRGEGGGSRGGGGGVVGGGGGGWGGRGGGGGARGGGGRGDGVIVGQDPGGDGMPIKQGKVE
jgi:hypothetical protein